MTQSINLTGWNEVNLADIAKIYDGTHQTPTYVNDGVPFYSVEHVTANDFSNTKYITEDVYESESKRVKIEKGDILMTRIGDVGTVKYIDWNAKASFYVSLALIKCANTVNSKFLTYNISSSAFQGELQKRTLRVAFPNKINLGDIGKCLTLLPPYLEQTRIVAVLETWDKAIEKLTQKIKVKKSIKKGLMQKLLTGQVRLPGFSTPWTRTKLGKITKSISKRNSKLQVERVLSVTNTKGFVLPAEQFSKTVASKDLSNYKIVEKENYAYNPSRINVGSIARLQRFDNGVLSPMYVIFSLEQTQVNTDFFYDWLFIDRTKASIKNAASGSVRESVDYKSFASIEIKMPKIEEQTAIANILTTADKEIVGIEKKLALLEEQKKFLLNNLITGKIRTPEAMKC